MDNLERKDDLGLELPENVRRESDAGSEPEKKGEKKARKISGRGFNAFITLVIVIVLIIVIGFLVNQYTSIDLFGMKAGNRLGQGFSGGDIYSPDNYHAVFLSNGQVYFGKITRVSDKNTVLEDIYYLQVANSLQQVPPTGTEQQPQLSLVKLGNELHGPQDMMLLNNAHILFVEELKNDGKVVEAITAYKQGGQAGQ